MLYDQTLSRVETYFDKTASKTWEQLTSDAPVSKIRQTVRAGRDRMRHKLLNRLPQKLEGARILDAGCGTGQLTTELVKTGVKIGGNYLKYYGKKAFDKELTRDELDQDNASDIYDGLKSLKEANYDVSFLQGDITKPDEPQKIINLVLQKYKSIDILVNNAGVAQHGTMEEFNDQLLDKIMNTNVDSVFRMCRSVLPQMKKQGEGVILNIGSISGLVSNIPQPQVAYNASKAAVHMLTKSLASDFAENNIRVNAIAPGYIDTEMTKLTKANEHWYETWNSMTPLKRMGKPSEIASAALFLCSPASSYITGEVLVIDCLLYTSPSPRD